MEQKDEIKLNNIQKNIQNNPIKERLEHKKIELIQKKEASESKKMYQINLQSPEIYQKKIDVLNKSIDLIDHIEEKSIPTMETMKQELQELNTHLESTEVKKSLTTSQTVNEIKKLMKTIEQASKPENTIKTILDEFIKEGHQDLLKPEATLAPANVIAPPVP